MTTAMNHIVSTTLDIFAVVEIRHWGQPDRHVLALFLLPEVNQLTLVNINAKHLCLLDLNQSKTQENALIVEDILEEMHLLSELLQEVLIPLLEY